MAAIDDAGPAWRCDGEQPWSNLQNWFATLWSIHRMGILCHPIDTGELCGPVQLGPLISQPLGLLEEAGGDIPNVAIIPAPLHIADVADHAKLEATSGRTVLLASRCRCKPRKRADLVQVWPAKDD